MDLSRRLLWNLYVGVAGAAAAVVANRVLKAVWEASTGGKPPDPNDPDARLRQTLLWTVASAAGLALATTLANRLAATTWERALGSPAPTSKR